MHDFAQLMRYISRWYH